MADEKRAEHLLEMRESLLREMEEADLEFSRIRMQVERMESDLRIGRPEMAAYREAKGRLLPRAEARVLGLYRELQKLEDRINMSRW
jgi:hypothetical protein